MRIYFLMIIVSLTGCAAPTYNYSPITKRISIPSIGTNQIAQVGESLVIQGKEVESKALNVKDIIQIANSYSLQPGYYLLRGSDEKYQTYEANSINGPRNQNPYITAVMVATDSQKICVTSGLGGLKCEVSSDFEQSSTKIVSKEAFQQTLIYNGKIGNEIKIGYREFSGDAARPAFSNEVTYDLTHSKKIGYKGARIEVIGATNEVIEYRVITNFSSNGQ